MDPNVLNILLNLLSECIFEGLKLFFTWVAVNYIAQFFGTPLHREEPHHQQLIVNYITQFFGLPLHREEPQQQTGEPQEQAGENLIILNTMPLHMLQNGDSNIGGNSGSEAGVEVGTEATTSTITQ
ncbi:unnamed protein product [Calypogeia fissa]